MHRVQQKPLHYHLLSLSHNNTYCDRYYTMNLEISPQLFDYTTAHDSPHVEFDLPNHTNSSFFPTLSAKYPLAHSTSHNLTPTISFSKSHISVFSTLEKIPKLQDNEGYLKCKRTASNHLKLFELWPYISTFTELPKMLPNKSNGLLAGSRRAPR